MSWFNRNDKAPEPVAPVVEPMPTPEVAPEPVVAPEPEARGAGKELLSSLMAHLRGVPTEAIAEEWCSREAEGAWPRTCPSVVPMAFFAHPCDEAVPFFEKYVFAVERLGNDLDPQVLDFVGRCKSRALETWVRNSMEQVGAETTIQRVLAGFGDDEMTTTMLREALEG